MIFPIETTRDQRLAISNAVWPIFTTLEQTQTLLNTCLEDFFEDSPQKEITASQAEWLSDMLNIVNTNLEDAIVYFKMVVGWRHGMEWLGTSINRYQRVLELEGVNNELSDIWQKLPENERKPIAEDWERTGGMDDGAALEICRSLLEKAKALYLESGQKP